MRIHWTPETKAVDASGSRDELAIGALRCEPPVSYAITGDTLVLVLHYPNEPREIYHCRIVATGVVR